MKLYHYSEKRGRCVPIRFYAINSAKYGEYSSDYVSHYVNFSPRLLDICHNFRAKNFEEDRPPQQEEINWIWENQAANEEWLDFRNEHLPSSSHPYELYVDDI
jgi:hypothetical protein